MRVTVEFVKAVMPLVIGLVCGLLNVFAFARVSAAEAKAIHAPPVEIVSDMPFPLVPIDLEVDFTSIIRESKLRGVLDTNSVEVINLASGEKEPHALSQHFLYGDRGRVRWVVRDPAHKRFETRSRTAKSALFVQYRDDQGKLRLRKDRIITLPDGKPMQNVVGQPAQLIPIDWDCDGLLDLVINHGQTGNTAPAVMRNIGTKSVPRFDFPKRLACFGKEMWGIAKHGPYYGVGDMDGDSKSDLVACPEMGTYLFFRRTAMDMDSRPKIVFGSVREVKFVEK